MGQILYRSLVPSKKRRQRDKIFGLFATHAVHLKGLGQAGRDEFSDFELRLAQAPHLTDGFIAFYCLYLQSISHSIKCADFITILDTSIVYRGVRITLYITWPQSETPQSGTLFCLKSDAL